MCGQPSYKGFHCPKKPKLDTKIDPKFSALVTCKFRKKTGHFEDTCFWKNRSEPRNQRNVNLCEDNATNNSPKNNDLVTAVIQDIPVDVLIDSGALNVSLISADVLKYFACQQKPTSCSLKGISDAEVMANSYVPLTIVFSEISIEADFVVVPASCL